MNLNAPQLLEPVFHFLDGLIRDYGDYLYMAVVCVSFPLIGWILSGGLRRKQSQPGSFISILVIRPPSQPPIPPMIESERETFPDDDEDSFAA